MVFTLPVPKKYILWIILALLAGSVAAFLFFPLGQEAVRMISKTINKKTHPALILSLYLVLPVFGFPISPFLILFGIKFGAVLGNVLVFAGLPLHLLVTYCLAQSVLGPWIQKFAEKHGFTVPQVPPHSSIWFSSMFMFFPGLPYSVKNYMLSLSGVPFFVYFLVGWLANGLMGIPVVILGDAAADWNLLILGIAVLIFMVIALLRFWIKKRFRDKGPCAR